MPIDSYYTYRSRPVSDIIRCLIETESIPNYACTVNIRNGNAIDPTEEIYKKYKDRIAEEVAKEPNRVIDNLRNIPMNHIVELDPTIHIQRVPFGVIYIYRTFSNQGAASSVIHKSTQFINL